MRRYGEQEEGDGQLHSYSEYKQVCKMKIHLHNKNRNMNCASIFSLIHRKKRQILFVITNISESCVAEGTGHLVNGSFQPWFLPRLVVNSVIVVARFLLLGAGHFSSGNATQTRSLKELNNVKFRLEYYMVSVM